LQTRLRSLQGKSSFFTAQTLGRHRGLASATSQNKCQKEIKRAFPARAGAQVWRGLEHPGQTLSYVNSPKRLRLQYFNLLEVKELPILKLRLDCPCSLSSTK
jgi:hypothetical protein